jgi:hypothetical protein
MSMYKKLNSHTYEHAWTHTLIIQRHTARTHTHTQHECIQLYRALTSTAYTIVTGHRLTHTQMQARTLWANPFEHPTASLCFEKHRRNSTLYILVVTQTCITPHWVPLVGPLHPHTMQLLLQSSQQICFVNHCWLVSDWVFLEPAACLIWGLDDFQSQPDTAQPHLPEHKMTYTKSAIKRLRHPHITKPSSR